MLNFKSTAEKFAEKAVRGETVLREVERQQPELQGELRVDASGRGASIEPDGFIQDDKFDQFTEARNNNAALSFNGQTNSVNVREDRVDEDSGPPNPFDVHESRSEYAQAQDEARDAQITTSPSKYASDPNSYDFPGVDTGPQFESTFGRNPDANALESTQQAEFGEIDVPSLDDLL